MKLETDELKKLMYKTDCTGSMFGSEEEGSIDNKLEIAQQVESFRTKYQKRNRTAFENGNINTLVKVMQEYFAACSVYGSQKLITGYVALLGVTVETFYAWVVENLADSRCKIFSEQLISTCEDATFKAISGGKNVVGAIFQAKTLHGKSDEAKVKYRITDGVTPSMSKQDLFEKYDKKKFIEATAEEK